MDLFSLRYLLFIIICLFLYYLPAGKSERRRLVFPRWVILLAESMGFYLLTGRAHILFMLTTACSVWLGALCMARLQESCSLKIRNAAGKDGTGALTREDRKRLKARTQRQCDLVLLAVLAVNFGILAWLKYWNAIAAALGSGRASALLLPLGISFYTFQATGYLLDVHGKKYEPEKNFFRFLLFVSWFPQLLQGPIGRYDRLAPQLLQEHDWDSHRAAEAVHRILFGLMKKYAVADLLAPLIAAVLDSDVSSVPGSLVVFAILMYSAQQYADFSGGIDIIMGISSLFGVELTPNFRQPYFATSLGDFWRRWHISLGAWMRDYVFYPFALTKSMQKLGKWSGRRFGKHLGRVLPAGIANILVFFLVGLWHGAELHYILWGLYNGLVIALSDLLAPIWPVKPGSGGRTGHLLRIARTFLIVNIGWYFDRIADFRSCMTCLRNTFVRFLPGEFAQAFQIRLLINMDRFTVFGSLALAGVCLMLVLVDSIQKERYPDRISTDGLFSGTAAGRILAAWLMITLTLASFLFSVSAGGFMYANF